MTAACGLALLLLAAAAGQASGRSRHKPQVGQVSLLYVMSASAGTLTPLPGHPGRFRLTLTRLERHVVWFSDRPARRSGAFLTSGLAGAWKGFGFASHPPNAALDYTDPTRGPGHTVILELARPRFDKRRGALSFAARIIDPGGVTTGNLAAHARDADRTAPRTVTDPTLFIDDTTAPEINGCILQPYTDCSGAELQGANLGGEILNGANLARANLAGANLSGARLSGATLTEANLDNANMIGANLDGAYVNFAFVLGTNFHDANLTGSGFVDASAFGANLSGANLTSTTFIGTNFSNDDLAGANLTDARLMAATFSGSDLADANLSGAELNGANLFRANLTGANLNGTNFRGASLFDADLLGAQFTGLNTFTDATLCATRMPWGGIWSTGCSAIY